MRSNARTNKYAIWPCISIVTCCRLCYFAACISTRLLNFIQVRDSLIGPRWAQVHQAVSLSHNSCNDTGADCSCRHQARVPSVEELSRAPMHVSERRAAPGSCVLEKTRDFPLRTACLLVGRCALCCLVYLIPSWWDSDWSQC